MVNFCSEKFLLCFVAVVLTFFIAGLLYLLCLKHVDNLGAYSIPSGDRPSHPIWLRKLSRPPPRPGSFVADYFRFARDPEVIERLAFLTRLIHMPAHRY